MPKRFRPAALCLLSLALLAAFATRPAQARGGYTGLGIGTTQTAACNNAIANVESHCAFHGAITTSPLGCLPIYNGSGDFLGYLCRCEASVQFCLNPGPVIPFP